MQAGAQVSGMAFGNGGDQVGGPGQGQGRREAADDHRNLPLQPEPLQRLVDRPLLETLPRDADMPAGRKTSGRDPAPAERMPLAHDADEAVPVERLGTDLRARRLAHDPGLQIDRSLAKRPAVPVQPQPTRAAHEDRAPDFHVLGSDGTPGATGVGTSPNQVAIPLDQFAKQGGPDASVSTAGGVVSVHAVFQLDAKTRELTVAIVNENGQLVRMIPPESVARMITAMAAYRGR